MRNSGPRFAPSLMYIKCCNKSPKSDMNEKTKADKASKYSYFACHKTYLLLHFRRGRVRFLHQICMGSCGRLTLIAECTAIVKVSLLLQHLSHTVGVQMARRTKSHVSTRNVTECEIRAWPWSHSVTCETRSLGELRDLMCQGCPKHHHFKPLSVLWICKQLLRVNNACVNKT